LAENGLHKGVKFYALRVEGFATGRGQFGYLDAEAVTAEPEFEIVKFSPSLRSALLCRR
jgi:hypothetical protein